MKIHMMSYKFVVPMCAILAACGTSGADDTNEGGTDGASDSPADARPDAPTDSGKDSGRDGASDAGADAKDDGATDAGGDADTDADADGGPADGGADSAPDAALDGGGADASCQMNYGFGTVSMNGCSSGENWTCGNDTYEFECTCPGAMCDCRLNNQSVKSVQSPSGCPNCSFTGSSVASLCGFPY